MNLKLRTPNYLLRTLLCMLFIIISELITQNSELLYGQSAKVTVPGDVTTQTTILDPKGSAPASANEGQIYYKDDPDNWPYYHNGSDWQPFGQAALAPKTVATKIVGVRRNPPDAALDSLDATRAEYICDGIDDQEEINRAINDLPADGGVVYLLEGTYNISAALLAGETEKGIVLHNGTALIGSGKGTVLKLVSGASNVNVINASNVNRIFISQLMIDGNNKTGSNNSGIYFNSVTNSRIDKIWGENISYRPVFLDSSSNNIITNNIFINNSEEGIKIHQNCDNNVVSDNIVNGNRYGISIWMNSNNNIVSGNNVSNNSGIGILVYYGGSDNNIIVGNMANSNQDGLSLQSNGNNIIMANTFNSNTRFGLYLTYSSYNSVINNTVYGNLSTGILLGPGAGDACKNNIISNNNIYDNGGAGSNDSIKIDGDSDNNLISSNRIYKSTGSGYGINIWTSTCDNNYIVGNLIDGAGFTAPINDSGATGATGTKYTDKTKLTFERASAQNPGSGGTINPGPNTYIPLNPASADYTLSTTKAIEAGKSAGDLLILENINATYKITVPNNAYTKLRVAADKQLLTNEFLTLIWDGTSATCCWVQTGGKD